MDRLTLLGIGAGAVAALMLALWLVQVRIRDASHVDAGWAYALAGLAALYAALADGELAHRCLIAVVGGIWGIRLGTYLLVNRVLGKPEDGRYQALREKWGARANLRFLVFFQAQAALDVVFSLPFLFAAFNPSRGLEALEWAGVALWLVAIAGEVTADRQLARWRANPDNRGKTARVGLWNYSRHPNYFFEWLNWCAYALVALAAPWGFVGLAAPALLLYLLFKVTGIPATEEQAVRSRGADYRRYQREVSVFVPWFPNKERAA